MRTSRTITVVGCHAGGEVGNVVVGGVLPPPGETVFEQMQALARDDSLRRLLLREPRGSVAVHANLIVPPTRDDCAAGYIIMEPTEYPAMSGSNTICVATVLLETGMVEMHEPETTRASRGPGRRRRGDRALQGRQVRERRAHERAVLRRAHSTRRSRWKGSARSRSTSRSAACGTRSPTRARSASRSSRRRRATSRSSASGSALAAREQLPCVHPENPEIAGVSIVQIAEPWQGVGKVTKNAVVVAPGRLDRSATGTGLSARMAVLHARGRDARRRRDDARVGDRLDLRRPHRRARRRSAAGPRSSRRSAAAPGSPASRRSARPDRPVPGGLPASATPGPATTSRPEPVAGGGLAGARSPTCGPRFPRSKAKRCGGNRATPPKAAEADKWGREDSNLRRLSRRVYSPFPLAARAHPRERGIVALAS